MATQDLKIFCMIPTPFKEDGSLDEEALRVHIRRLAAANNCIYTSSGGAGEAQVLTNTEMRRVCEIAVEEAAGKVPVYAGMRESRSAEAMYDIAKEGVAAGVDAVQLYQLDNGHGMIPSPREQELYWRTLLDRIDHPVAISIHYEAKFKASAKFLRGLCDQYPQIVAFSLVGSTPALFTELRDAIPERIDFYAALPDVVQFVSLGARGAINPVNNMIPYTVRSILDGYLEGDLAKVSRGTRTVQRMLNIVNQWAPSTARWVKMGMKVLGTGNGVLRPPYILPPEEDQRRMADQFAAMRLMEIEAESRATADKAGLVGTAG